MSIDWLDVLRAIWPPLAIVVAGAAGWFVKSKTEQIRAMEERLGEKRREVYEKMLDPLATLLADLEGSGPEEATKKMLSYEYRKTYFDLLTYGSDGIIRAYNRLMQHAYKGRFVTQEDRKDMLCLWGGLLLNIRRNLGGRRFSMLTKYEMLRGIVEDIESVEPGWRRRIRWR